jgi:hypothetical protein
MKPLPRSSTDTQLIEVVHQWVRLLEAEKYDDAFNFTDHIPSSGWSPSLIKQFIESYGEAEPGQKVTFDGKPTDIQQRIDVSRWGENSCQEIGEIWYDLNINGFVSDVTATFRICVVPGGLTLRLNDVHVM